MKIILKKSMALVSTVAMLCLFVTPSLTSLVLTAMEFAAVLAVVSWNKETPEVLEDKFWCVLRIGITLWVMLLGYVTFKNTWMPSSKVSALAGKFDLTSDLFLSVIGIIGCMVGCYIMYLLSGWIIVLVRWVMQEKLPEKRPQVMIANLKQNWYLPISVMAFFVLSETLTLGYFTGVLMVTAFSVIVSTQFSSVFAYAKCDCVGLYILSILTAMGVCWSAQTAFCSACISKGISQTFVWVMGAICACASMFAVYLCLMIFWKEMRKIISENHILKDITTVEYVVYGVLVGVMLITMMVVFGQTDAFYGTPYDYDIIYTSDSPALVKGNVYLVLTHLQNDLRQPLFAVFAAPFLGVPYLLGELFRLSAPVQAMLLNGIQILLMFAANFLLTKMMKLNSLKRICFMLLSSCTYMQLLFAFMMEQYVVAYFWLAFCLYLIVERQHPTRMVLWGAGGTLLTSMVLLPFLSKKCPWKDLREWIVDMVKYGLEFAGLMLVFCRFDVFFDLATKVSMFTGFTGQSLTFMDKVRQYSAFIHNCFVVPDAGVVLGMDMRTSWKLHPVTEMNITGIVLLLLVIVSGIWNRDKRSSLLAVGWVAFSCIMLLVLGWGAAENGLILYALYFGWAFLVLIFQLVEKVEDRIHVKFILPTVSFVGVVVLLAMNIPAMRELVNFAITYYPI